MGLDMHARTIPAASAEGKLVDLAPDLVRASEELWYWRKHPDLHGWLERLYRTRGGATPDFNLANLVLLGEDLDALESAIRENRLPKTSGFFFGESDPDRVENDLAFVEKAREAIASGLAVLYYAWW